MLNRVTLIGRLGAAPELRYTPANLAVTELRLCTSRKWKNKSGEMQEQAQWHSVVLWDKTAELAAQYLQKGDAVCVEGEIRYEKWVDKEGAERTSTKIHGENMTFLPNSRDGKDRGGAAPRDGHEPSYGGRAPPAVGGGSEQAPDNYNDDIPF